MGRIMVNGENFSGSEIVANPTLEGGEPTLNSLEIDGDKFALGGGGGGGSIDTLIYHLTIGNTWENFTLPTIPTDAKLIVKYYARQFGISGECEFTVSELATYSGYTTILTSLAGNIPINMAKDANESNKLYISTNGGFSPSGYNELYVGVYVRE